MQTPDVLIIFGSSSDNKVYNKILHCCAKEHIAAKLIVASAHKSPLLLGRILEKEQGYNAIIAGAGLAAHLPGVVAAKTIRPVIGVPCHGNYHGLDALLSVHQMPAGVPVLGRGVDGGTDLTDLQCIFQQYEQVVLSGETTHERVTACTDILQQFGVPFSIRNRETEAIAPLSLIIHFSPLSSFTFVKNASKQLVINVPLHEQATAQDALSLLKLTEKGFWVGLNRAENAALAAIEVMSMTGKYDQQLHAYRRKLAEAFEK
ncbi:AIR carboxylase family protein [Candidatus Woesearchaeota archaeon]|nr:AIR carboxylase family protein [Candidatus Woesearchaeota archaeon]